MSEEIIVNIDKDLEDIMPMFLENRRKDLDALSSLLEQMDYDSIQTIGHRLAGNAGSYGLDELGKIGVALESACVDKNDEAIRTYCQQYAHFVQHLKINYC